MCKSWVNNTFAWIHCHYIWLYNNLFYSNTNNWDFHAFLTSWSIKDSTTTFSDYQAVSGPSIMFVPNGPKTQSVQISINNDNIVEGIEAFNLELSTSDSHVNTSSTPILIRDDDSKYISSNLWLLFYWITLYLLKWFAAW